MLSTDCQIVQWHPKVMTYQSQVVPQQFLTFWMHGSTNPGLQCAFYDPPLLQKYHQFETQHSLSCCWRIRPTWRRTTRTTPPFLLTQPQVPKKRPEMAPTGVHGRHNNSHKQTTSCPSLGAKCSRHKPMQNNYGHMPWQPRNRTPTSLVWCRQNKAGRKHCPLPAYLAHLFQHNTQ